VDLSIIILSWNTRDLLEKCLRSVACPHADIATEVIVVDNASEDDSREMVRSLFPEVHLLVNLQNLGFGAGNNTAIPYASGRYLLFLNSDTVVTPGALSAMVRYADAHPDIGILGAKLLNGDGSLQYSCRRYPNLGTGFFRNTPLGRLFPKNRFTIDYLMQDWDHTTPRDVDWLSAAALMIRRPLAEQLGGFDEDFFMYCEDVDLCWRANHTRIASTSAAHEVKEKSNSADSEPTQQVPESADKTWLVTYFPDAVIYHYIGRSTDKVPTRMTYEFHRSQYLFYTKHYAATTPLAIRPLIPIGIALRAVGQMARYKYRYWKRRLVGSEPPQNPS
jgi:GT2 family glycosyltransferase